VLFKIFRVHDKTLRRIVFTHIVADITRLNQKSKNSAVNRGLQNFMFSMLKDSFRIAAKMSLDVMIKLYRKRIWNDEKTVNVIATACFSDDSKMVVAGCNFFLGSYDEDDEEEEAQKSEKIHEV
jgi:protein SDA1